MASQGRNTSSSMPPITSSQGIPPLPPVPSGSQKNAENAAKKTTPVFTKATSMKDYMQQQDKTNDRILHEIDEIKKLKRLMEDHSPLVPRSLDFGTPATTAQHSTASGDQYHGGSSSIHFGSSAMTQAQGPYFQPSGSSLQPQGSSFQHQGLGGYMGTLSAQRSYPQHPGSSSQVQGSSS
ncbi:hypothetical protein HanXRQr2_Chr13g0568901 [Helianthus annuus]|uniref:Uncharacterized protein n=1 Tax=Helianthus annuus TaxID=4232 RepID=A0A9K3EE32_HELAN|nr:hypothetical protein HanXRQr2_Chr13g0568901 [Helianthus annuus]